ncbi:Rv3654c family TadE-like protein [Nocardiopsis ganjiahuensis]|uniref:Rv3654c family TadE-like protein n=1 Tax=Nocardiopsis ganjiahuensis TaxID=239984 RepID=UPI0003463AE7|nr:Rv3654c family TadE-like protein [Nocardiopsis ganjiahuensis]
MRSAGRQRAGPGPADGGSATVWWISLCLALWFLTYAVLLTAAARLDRDRAATAADLAALAAAARAHEGAGAACAVAERTASANGAALDTCDLNGLTVTVRVSLPASALPHEVGARSRAGPAHDPAEEVE